jgi:hypothetical protein
MNSLVKLPGLRVLVEGSDGPVQSQLPNIENSTVYRSATMRRGASGWQCCRTVCLTHHHPVHDFMHRLNHLKDLHDCVHGKRVAFGPKIIGYHDLRVVSEHCLGAFNCAFTHLHMSGSDGQSIVLNAQRTRHIPYPKRLRLMTPVDLAKFCYVDGDLFSSRSCAPIPPMINNRQRWVSY